jgi:hypothetical protein
MKARIEAHLEAGAIIAEFLHEARRLIHAPPMLLQLCFGGQSLRVCGWRRAAAGAKRHEPVQESAVLGLEADQEMARLPLTLCSCREGCPRSVLLLHMCYRASVLDSLKCMPPVTHDRTMQYVHSPENSTHADRLSL